MLWLECAFVFVFGGATLNNVTLYPMIRPASITDGTYEPYTKQSHISLVSDGLKGIPVTDSSLATYTDENGQMIRGDYPDHTEGVFKKYSDIWELTSDLGWVAHGLGKGFIVELSQVLKSKEVVFLKDVIMVSREPLCNISSYEYLMKRTKRKEQ